MRLLEVITICLLALAGLLLLRKARQRLPLLLLCAAFFVLLLHVFLEGPHWQMAPAYAAALLLGCSFFWSGNFVRRIAAVCSLLLLLLAIGFSHAMPMFHLPRPDGVFAIGTAVYPLTDSSRMEDAVNDGSKREIVVQAWYPANCKGHGLAPYRRWSETSLASSYQRYIFTHACADASLAETPAALPVLVFNPAMSGRRTQSTFLMEELASQGFVVFAIDHPYDSGPVEVSDGKVLQAAPDPWGNLAARGAAQMYRQLDAKVDKEAADTRFLLDTLQRWNADTSSRFFHKLDLARIGAIGHSLGGSVSVESAGLDPRIRAVFDMSGPMYAQAREKGVHVPFFYMTEKIMVVSEAEMAKMSADDRVGAEMDMQDMNGALSTLARDGGYYVQLPTYSHASFTDKPLFSPYVRLGGGDQKEAARLHDIIRQYAVAFFQKTLLGQDASLLKEPSPFSGTTFRIYQPAH